jgi:hypothetical protein
MDISEVETLLNSLRLLGFMAPQHVFLTDEPITAQVDGKLFFRGLAPAGGNAIVLSKHADVTTTPHELAHTLGLGEFAADMIGKLAALKYNVSKGLPFSGLRLREVRYQEVDDLPAEFKNRVKHYILVK